MVWFAVPYELSSGSYGKSVAQSRRSSVLFDALVYVLLGAAPSLSLTKGATVFSQVQLVCLPVLW